MGHLDRSVHCACVHMFVFVRCGTSGSCFTETKQPMFIAVALLPSVIFALSTFLYYFVYYPGCCKF